ncbi:pterin-4-alpha-carbinolamine dehydratase [Histoplasma ohiense]|nr:pterin-4-alpha-carbinolamine dehydratase [Histoplasma ohiense (nom. inval.)]
MIPRVYRSVYAYSRLRTNPVSRQRYFSMASPNLNSAVQPKYASTLPDETKQLAAETNSLLDSNWSLDEEQMGLQKTYYFKTYTKCQDFFNMIAIKSKSANHHSTMTVKFRSVHIHWTTHSPPGLSAIDTLMARYCDEQAKMLGTVDENQVKTCTSAPATKT